jgi:hypothetical protein
VSDEIIDVPARVEGSVERRRCRAHNRAGEQCKKAPVAPYEVCEMHGAGGGRPITTGKYSKFLPARLKERYEEFINSPGWLELKEEIGLVTARIADLVSGLDCGEAPLTRREWRELAFRIRESVLAGDDCIDDLEKLCHSLDQATVQDDIWEKTMLAIEQQRKLKETEVKRMVAANQVLTVQESYTMIQRLVSLVEESVQDERTRLRAIRELHALLERKNDPKALNNGRLA